MSDHDAARRTRRGFLAATGAVSLAALAGCGGGSSETETTPAGGDGTTPAGGDGTTTTSEMETTTTDPTTTAGGGTLSAPALGPEDAGVTVMSFEDYACPHCKTYSLDVFPEIKSQFVDAGQIRYEFHDLPIPVADPASYTAANAARAVQDTVGDEAYFSFSKGLFENQGDLGPDLYGTLASDVGADPGTVRTAAAERRYQETVQADRQRGVEMGVQGTPAIFVDGTLVEGYSLDRVTGAIEDAL
jgi:protein-disulfide isomerase